MYYLYLITNAIYFNCRFEVLGKLNILVKEWIRDVSLAKNMPEQVSEVTVWHYYMKASACNYRTLILNVSCLQNIFALKIKMYYS